MTGIEIAEFLFKNHEHKVRGKGDYIVYKESVVMELLTKLGVPLPDWDAFAEQMETKQQ